MFRIILSIIIGFVLGRERKKHDKSGGSRTLAIVCMTACLIAILTQKICLLNPVIHNFSRLMSYGIAGIGFVGSGIIMQNKKGVDGLTTASSLFAMMPIGYFIGLGFIFYGIISSIFMYLILESKYWKK